jgi:hypothetical protein
MFEALIERARMRAHSAAEQAARAVAEAAQEALGPGVRAQADGTDVVISGRGVARRFRLDAPLRWAMLALASGRGR